MASRLLDINPLAEIRKVPKFYSPGSAGDFFADRLDYALDCIDTLACKIDLAIEASQRGIPIISCMGTGNKLDPSKFQVSDISKTRDCPLARNMRKELRKRGVRRLKVIYSQEAPMVPLDSELHGAMLRELSQEASSRRAIPGSVSFVPAAAGLLMAAEAVKDILAVQD
jgi:tRNA A37 threonylcarbamoyladenosine dehydratase